MFSQLVTSSDYDFILECGITKPIMKMNLTDKQNVLSAVCLQFGVLGSLAELEQLKRGLHTATFENLLDAYSGLLKPIFLYSQKQMSANCIQDIYRVHYSDSGSNKRMKEETIMMNWITYLQELEGTCILCTINIIIIIIMKLC